MSENAIAVKTVDEFPSLSFVGPELHIGPLPAIIYFALSKEESLATDPYNHPVKVLHELPLRIFSLSLPFHGNGYEASKAIPRWAAEFASGQDILKPFLAETLAATQFLLNNGLVTNIGAMGLSRGALIAGYLAACSDAITHFLGFAPLIGLGNSQDFANLTESPLVKQYDLIHYLPKLHSKSLRFYVGNYDRRIGTEKVFKFIHETAKYAYEQRMRAPPIELYIRPSIGYMGHGTDQKTFEEGAQWLAQQLLNP